jgi:TnpA family transposase
MFRTPTAMDTNQNVEKYAARILAGKVKRSSNHPVQKTLSMDIAMEQLKNNPEQIQSLLKDEMVKRDQLPNQKEFVDYLRSQTNPKDLAALINIKLTTVEHWFRYDEKGFSYPSIDDWNKIKQHLNPIKFNEELTHTTTIEWKE